MVLYTLDTDPQHQMLNNVDSKSSLITKTNVLGYWSTSHCCVAPISTHLTSTTAEGLDEGQEVMEDAKAPFGFRQQVRSSSYIGPHTCSFIVWEPADTLQYYLFW